MKIRTYVSLAKALPVLFISSRWDRKQHIEAKVRRLPQDYLALRYIGSIYKIEFVLEVVSGHILNQVERY